MITHCFRYRQSKTENWKELLLLLFIEFRKSMKHCLFSEWKKANRRFVQRWYNSINTYLHSKWIQHKSNRQSNTELKKIHGKVQLSDCFCIKIKNNDNDNRNYKLDENWFYRFGPKLIIITLITIFVCHSNLLLYSVISTLFPIAFGLHIAHVQVNFGK